MERIYLDVSVTLARVEPYVEVEKTVEKKREYFGAPFQRRKGGGEISNAAVRRP